jgi:hypothetical protein
MRVPLPGCLKVVMPAPGAARETRKRSRGRTIQDECYRPQHFEKTAFYQQSMPRTQSATQLKVGLLPE